MLKDYDFENEKLNIIQKLSQRRETNKINLNLLRPQKTILSPQYNFYKPNAELKNIRTGSKKTEQKIKPRSINNLNNFSDNKTYSKTGKNINGGHSSKPSKDMTIQSLQNKMLIDTISHDNYTNFDISQLKSEKISVFTDKDTSKLHKDKSQRGTSVYSTKRSGRFDNPYNNGFKGFRKQSELEMRSPNSLKSRYQAATPTKPRDFGNKKQLEVNIFVNKGKREF